MTENPSQTKSFKENDEVIVVPKENEYLINIKCPLSFNLKFKPQTYHGDIAYGILKGLASFLGYENVNSIKSQIIHNTPICQFRISKGDYQ